MTATAAVVGAIVGEFVASQRGLGYVIITTQSSMNTPVAFAALVWISLLGLLLFGFVALLSRLLVPWAPTSERRIVADGRGSRRRNASSLRRIAIGADATSMP